MGERPHSIRGGPGSIPGRCSSIFGIWREVLGCNVYIKSQYLTPAIIYRDIIYALYPSSTPPPKTTAIFRDFKKSTAMCKVHNVGLRYIITINVPLFKKLRDIIFLGGENHFINHFEGHFEGAKTFLTP